VERYVLSEARAAGVLDFEEASHTGEYRFSCRPRLRGLDRLLRVCLIPELLLPVPGARDQQVENLLERSRSLCTPPEKELFDQLLGTLADPRLGLLWLPQRLLETMIRPASRPPLSTADRVDFALEVPSLIRPDWLKLVIELDDDIHTGAQVRKDQERDRCLRV
jgi:hypothetical protein